MQVVDLFSGIGGFSLAAKWMGWDTVQMVEIDPFCQKVLKYHFPNAKLHDDVKTFGIDVLKNSRWDPDGDTVLCGGFPCQPYSTAGKRLGKADERHLWPEMLRAIREIQPTWVVGENARGLVSWNGGLVFDEVQSDLETLGYEVLPILLPAASVGAPHRRDRIWFVAYSGMHGHKQRRPVEDRCSKSEGESIREEWKRLRNDDWRTSEQGIIAHTKGQQGKRVQLEQREISKQEQRKLRGSDCENNNTSNPNSFRQPRKEYRETRSGFLAKESFSKHWENFPTQSPIRWGNDGFSERLAGITFPKWRNESIKALGNAVVPQLVLRIFKAIQDTQNRLNETKI